VAAAGQAARRPGRVEMTVSDESGPWRITCIAALGVLALLSGFALASGVLPLDSLVRDAILRHATPPVEAVAGWLNYGGGWQFLLPAMLLVFAASAEGRRFWWLWALVLPLGAGWEGVLKELVGRARPESPAMGFPSGHVTATASFAVIVIYLAGRSRLRPRARWLVAAVAVALIVGVGLARIVLRAHWPSDVLGGLALGVAVSAAAAWWHGAQRTHPRRPTPRAGPAPSTEGMTVP
jgi:membrane-associated phospholipid phosphatase